MAALDGDEYITLCPLTIKQFPWHLPRQERRAQGKSAAAPGTGGAPVPPSDGHPELRSSHRALTPSSRAHPELTPSSRAHPAQRGARTAHRSLPPCQETPDQAGSWGARPLLSLCNSDTRALKQLATLYTQFYCSLLLQPKPAIKPRHWRLWIVFDIDLWKYFINLIFLIPPAPPRFKWTLSLLFLPGVLSQINKVF